MNTLKELLTKLDAFKAKWPNDHKSRIGYVLLLESIVDAARVVIGQQIAREVVSQ